MKILILPIIILFLAGFVSADCGDGKIDADENCAICASDVTCAAGESCSPDGECIPSSSFGGLILYIVIGAGIIGLIIIFWLIKKLTSGPKINPEVQQAAKQYAKEISPEAKKPSFFKRIFGKKQIPATQQQTLSQAATTVTPPQPVAQVQPPLVVPPPAQEQPLTEDEQQKANSLIPFIKNSISMGHDAGKIKQALLEKGWEQKIVDAAIKDATSK